MARNIDNWKATDVNKQDFSQQLRADRNVRSQQEIRLATGDQTRRIVQNMSDGLKLAAPHTPDASPAHQLLTPQLRALLPAARSEQRSDLRQQAADAGSKNFLNSKDAANKLTNLEQSAPKSAARSDVQDPRAVTNKGQAPDARAQARAGAGYTLSQAKLGVPLRDVDGKHAQKEMPRQPVRTDDKKRGDVTKEPVLEQKTVADTAVKAKDIDPKLATNAALAAKALPEVKDAAPKTERSEKKEKSAKEKDATSSLAVSEGKVMARDLSNLLGGVQTNVGGGGDNWKPSDSNAIAEAKPAVAMEPAQTLLDKTPVTAYNEPGPHDELRNRSLTFKNDVVKPHARLKEIADLNDKLGERLAEIALSDKVVGSDPELKELFMAQRHCAKNSYGGMSA